VADLEAFGTNFMGRWLLVGYGAQGVVFGVLWLFGRMRKGKW
jgi:hypothetical protein